MTLAGKNVLKTRTMWLVLFLLLSTLTVLCAGKKDTSCSFDSYYGWCDWKMDKHYNCQWERSNRDGGYLYLKGANRCSSRIAWGLHWWDGYATDYLTIEYYVTGPGPFSLSVSNDKSSKPDWTCSIQPGKAKRLAHVSVTGKASYLYITGKVAKNSGIVITQIWNSLRGKKVQHVCPLLPTENYDNMDNRSTITRPTMTTTTLTSSNPTTKTIKTITPTRSIRSTTKAIPTRSTTRIQIKNITTTTTTITTSSQKSTRFKTPKWNSTINMSNSTGQKRTATTVKLDYQTTETVLQSTLLHNMTTGSGNNLESTTHNVAMGKTDVEIEKEKTKKLIIGCIFGAVVFTILMIFLTIIIIFIKKQKRMTNLPFTINVNHSVAERNGNLLREIFLSSQS